MHIRKRKHFEFEVRSRHYLQVLTAYLKGIRIRIRVHLQSEAYVYVYISTYKAR